MGRPRNAAPQRDDNHVLTDDEIADLQHYYSIKIRGAQAAHAEAKAVADAKRQDVNNFFALVKGDLQISRKDFEEVLALQDMNEAEFIEHEKKRTKRMAAQGLPVGTQLDMFPKADTVDDLGLAKASGKRAGLRGDDPVVPECFAGVTHSAWMEGWHDGQAENIAKLGRAQTILDARKAAQDEPEGDEDEEEVDDEEAIKAQARALKNSSFMDTAGAGEDDDTEHMQDAASEMEAA